MNESKKEVMGLLKDILNETPKEQILVSRERIKEMIEILQQ